ncbi:MAG: hypothetical protein EBY00_00260 [Actinobacteria bacterium]|nr:hypothetical protein [Actinomycetota bacterium]
MASAIIYLAIIGMWVAYFLPRWIHTHDEFSGKSVERYKSALRVVAGETESSYSLAIHTDLDAPFKQSQALMRRRIIFVLIFSSLLATSVGAAMNLLSWLSIGIPVSGFVIYLAHTRKTINRQRVQRRRIEGLQRTTNGISHVNLSEVVAPKQDSELWVPLAEREITGIVLLPQGSAATRNVWTPNSIPVPTYVNAPKAVTPRRIIDLTTPGQWSEEQERLAREALAAAAPSADEVFDQQLAEEAANKRDRAVNS